MEVAAKLSSKGQQTVPKAVRDALDLHDGDHVVSASPTVTPS